MRVLVFDTETTGLPKSRNTTIKQTDDWPHIIQLSYILYNTEYEKCELCVDQIIQIADDVEITPKSIEMHGITRAKSKQKGVSLSLALDNFKNTLRRADIIVGHNISFDKKMIIVESNRGKNPINFSTKQEYCTMMNTIDLCRIEKLNSCGEKYFKYPTLTELHQRLFGIIPKNTHDSMADVLFTLRCYLYLQHGTKIKCSMCRKLYDMYIS